MSAWKDERSWINHGWLQNSVIVGLGHALSVLEGRVRSRRVRQTLIEDALRWQDRKSELLSLLERFKEEMSPKVFFCLPPLVYCAEETKKWLVPVTHELWLRRENVEEKCGAALAAFVSAERAFEKLRKALERLPPELSAPEAVTIKPELAEFSEVCELLSKSISDLPHEVRAC